MTRVRQAIALSFLLLGTAAQPAWAEAKLAPVLQPFVDRNELAGAVMLVADSKQILAHETVGWMDAEAKTPMQPNCLFWIASQTKPMTCVALMILAEEGKVNIDDPVEKYLPEFKGQMYIAEKDSKHQLLKRPSRPMLLRDLMSHTSGLPSKTAIMRPTLDSLPLELTVAANAMIPLQAEPGAKCIYSNPGINTVGRVVEAVSGMPYERFIEERLFRPLGMVDTTFWPNEEQVQRLAKAHRPAANKTSLEVTNIAPLRYPLSDRTRHSFPGGGLFSTALDLVRFYQMIACGGEWNGQRILSESAVAQMTLDQTGDLKAGRGFGFDIKGVIVGKGGSHGTRTRIDRKTGLITIYLIQHADYIGKGREALPTFQNAATAMFSTSTSVNEESKK